MDEMRAAREIESGRFEVADGLVRTFFECTEDAAENDKITKVRKSALGYLAKRAMHKATCTPLDTLEP